MRYRPKRSICWWLYINFVPLRIIVDALEDRLLVVQVWGTPVKRVSQQIPKLVAYRISWATNFSGCDWKLSYLRRPPKKVDNSNLAVAVFVALVRRLLRWMKGIPTYDELHFGFCPLFAESLVLSQLARPHIVGCSLSAVPFLQNIWSNPSHINMIMYSQRSNIRKLHASVMRLFLFDHDLYPGLFLVRKASTLDLCFCRNTFIASWSR